ncbi:hypothetical protein KNP414_04800 [Paenibacillus mucilaginosus KNP414]|uniref:Uncharacterized protein n=1 Tax=Paenibacillus mucilaginosus (strain KNP414) TaxID=1036673 RepID=F8FHY8_PAEMK|nr:hypothetical protein KNP414_04800 [Paenibacillus mucilaginosus KNP414]
MKKERQPLIQQTATDLSVVLHIFSNMICRTPSSLSEEGVLFVTLMALAKGPFWAENLFIIL